MSRRVPPLTGASQLLALLALLLVVPGAQAHRLDAQVFLLPNGQIQVEGWFSSGDAARGAKVEVFGAQGQRITEGQLNDQGVFVFSHQQVEPLRIVLSAGAGHRKEVTVTTSARERAPSSLAKDAPTASPSVPIPANPVPLAERSAGPPIKDVLIGISFLLAAAAFALSLRNARRLRALDPTKRLPR